MVTDQELKSMGFEGFKTIKNLQKNDIFIPEYKGVYMILTPTDFDSEFTEDGAGGFFKGKNPNVSLDELNANWVENANIVYIGKAGGSDSKATLYSRLKQYLEFGEGKAVGHWGGRYIWQLKNSGNLLVCWKKLKEDDPTVYESKLIAVFTQMYGKRPFANLKD